MDDHILRIFLGEIQSQISSALMRAGEMEWALKQRSPNARFFAAAQAFLVHAAMVSKLFWPSDQTARAKTRGRELRAVFGLGEDHPLSKRTLRNHLEHYDDRVDDWVERSRNRHIVIDMIGPPTAIGGSAIDPEDLMRVFDPSTGVFWFRGEKFDIKEMASALQSLAHEANARLTEIETRRYRKAATG